jgi:putative sterol carrier protein
MAMLFPSEEWVTAYGEAINANPEYRTGAADWTHGVVALVIKALPPLLREDFGIWLDLDRGVCHEAKAVTPADAAKAPFCIAGEYAYWKQVIAKELDPIKGMMQGKLKLKGDLPTIVRAVRAAQELVNSSTMVDSRFVDE